MNPVGHKVTCRCSEECSGHARQYLRDWKARNADKVREYKAKERAQYVPHPRPARIRPEPRPRPEPTEAELAARRERRREYNREFNRAWRAANPGKVRAQKARYRTTQREVARRYRAEQREIIQAYKRDWVLANPEKVRAYQVAYGPERQAENQRRWRAANRDYVKQVKRAYEDDRERVVNPKAVNRGAAWSEVETRIALDPSLSVAAAALMLGRTIPAVSNVRCKARRAAA